MDILRWKLYTVIILPVVHKHLITNSNIEIRVYTCKQIGWLLIFIRDIRNL